MDEKTSTLSKKFQELKAKAIEKGLTEQEVIQQLLIELDKPAIKSKSWNKNVIFLLIILPVLSAVLVYQFVDVRGTFGYDEASPCLVENSIFIMEAARPIANCKMCEGLTEVPKVSNLTAEKFVNEYAYSGRPLVVKDATENWTAVEVFSFKYFQEIYGDKALNVTEDECQFFPYKTEFHTLREVFNMSKERSQFKAEPWYVGW